MKYSEITEGLKVVINRGKDIWSIIDPIQVAFDKESDENDYNKARVYCENELTSNTEFIPVKMLDIAPVCPKCSTTLKVLTSRKGKFLGCRNHPKCSHYEPIQYTGNHTLSSERFTGEAWNH